MIEWLIYIYEQLSNPIFWIEIAQTFYILGPIAPIGLAFIESIFPALPLIVIVTWNVYSFGPILGFVYSWVGNVLGSIVVFSFFRLIGDKFFTNRLEKHKLYQQFKEKILNHSAYVLFFMSTLPFTPSSVVNMVYGFSKFPKTTFIAMISAGKFIIVTSLAIFGHLFKDGLERNPINLIYAIVIYGSLYVISRFVFKKYDIK